MKHIILFTYILIFSTGFAALVALIILDIRKKGMFVHRMIVVQALFIANLALVAVYYYLDQVVGLVSVEGSSLEQGMGAFGALLNIALYFSILGVLSSKEFALVKKYLLSVARLLNVCSIILLTVNLFFHVFGNGINSLVWSVILYLLIALTIGFFGLILLLADSYQTSQSLKTLVRGIGWCSVAFVPLGLGEFVLNRFTANMYHPLSLEYLYYLGCNGVMIVASLQSLAKRASAETAFGILNEEVAAKFSLTGREKEMANKIAQGKSNKEIAFDLGISEATVRTHIYNLYQKVGAQSRIELLNLLHD
ncbi:response regulator containing a CheY-like receiver domain and an HTH DNA-binding domain [Sphaerochaeta pleomorpha str. Grapes]|uniref:Response regulator containing a CheY-like receiver domain and an HTH DNA-binding domain n=1 Tax=Sphaerochaeta pleomorpha (strain ATCC BAA-1885 / DSM 22778 / Grapes) TaxID=158190 RepID=G8QRX6_SPHPG|nr:helix-turn-helix transcriptional regulator [Sphaerochaeta pleomorpha]AEV29974.1 response regulator containing a CheY-like receiver domain and an HTH DNA-binding domain [Sphaerochaeta pleomorpha str. Grapes]